ncbi:hypothetical protein [Pseudaquidulcibacter saccharophilus]|uniref:hypothetical protein n=1 Tax=Pseudaquidulcibacter saccharophilus TaxID=2831900 RepID=UPI001EFEFDB2|nr:hypothetical protein [Pseudaquidulcibacter saccharophilus]
MNNQNQDQESLAVKATDVHGARVGMRTFMLFAALCGVIGFFTGGIILPFLKYKPKIEDTQYKGDSNKDILMISIGPQNVLATPIEGAQPVATGLTVERVISEYEVKSSQAGYNSNMEVEKGDGKIEIRFNFEEPSQKQKESALIAPVKDFPKSVVLTFVASEEPGSIVLSQIRHDGKALSPGAAFVELVKMDGNPPELAQGQYLTRDGIFEIKSNEHGLAAFIDNKQVFPQTAQNALNLSFNNDKNAKSATSNESIRIVGIEPNKGIFKDRIILVSSAVNAAPCTSQAIIVDVPRHKTEVLGNMLYEPRLYLANGKKSFVIGGFCDKDDKGAAIAPQNYRVEATYNLQTGEIIYNKKSAQDAIPQLAPTLENVVENNGNWRTTSPTRIASPLNSGSLLVSLACNPAGGVSISVSGLPSPSSGEDTRVSFGGVHASTSAGMKYIASANSYEMLEVSRRLETKQVLNVLKGEGSMSVSALGIKGSVAAPGADAVNTLVSRCVPLAVKPAVIDGDAPSPTPAKPAPPKTIAAKPAPAKTVVAKPNSQHAPSAKPVTNKN